MLKLSKTYLYNKDVLGRMDSELEQNEDPIYLLKKLADSISHTYQKAGNGDLDNQSWQGIAFLSGAERYLIALQDVIEIITMPKLMPIPNVNRWLKGITNFRGDILPVTDLQDFIQAKVTHYSQDVRVFIIRANNEQVGLIVSAIMGLMRVPKDAACQNETPGNHQNYFKGIYHLEDQDFKWLNVDALVNCKRFSAVDLNLGFNVNRNDIKSNIT